jgi:hypothetical protein
MGFVRPPIVFYAFDLLRLDGEDLRGLPIEERKAKLAALLKPAPPAVRYSAAFTEDIDGQYLQVLSGSVPAPVHRTVHQETPRAGRNVSSRARPTNCQPARYFR